MCILGKVSLIVSCLDEIRQDEIEDVRNRETNEFLKKTLLHIKSTCDIIKCRFNYTYGGNNRWHSFGAVVLQKKQTN